MNSMLLYSFLFMIAAIVYYVVAIRLYKKTTYYDVTHKNYFATVTDKGNFGEYLIYKKLRTFEKDGAKFLFNCYLPKDKGETTEVDVLMIHDSGVYVFESKNYSGWIFGSSNQKTWTQTLPNGREARKEHFLNPIMQNDLHIKWLQNQIGTYIPIHSIVVFSERCTLQKINIYNSNASVINRSDVRRTVSGIHKGLKNKISKEKIESIYSKLYPFTQVSDAVKKNHIQMIKSQIGKYKQEDVSHVSHLSQVFSQGSMVCPKCGGALVLRKAKRGKHTGDSFYGCSNFPKCKFIKK